MHVHADSTARRLLSGHRCFRDAGGMLELRSDISSSGSYVHFYSMLLRRWKNVEGALNGIELTESSVAFNIARHACVFISDRIMAHGVYIVSRISKCYGLKPPFYLRLPLLINDLFPGAQITLERSISRTM